MVWYFAGINIFTFFIYGIDKYLAIKKRYRISEYSLFVLSVFGGAIGSILGMKVFHHKTRKTIFWIFNILFLIIWIIILFS
jgi:uncharacterized membrane protein YsdA (DUF1294 family)